MKCLDYDPRRSRTFLFTIIYIKNRMMQTLKTKTTILNHNIS